jgi:midasin
VYRGFCAPDDDKNKNSGEGDDNKEDDGKVQDGTGIGEGRGKDNVSKEMEFDEQMLGMKVNMSSVFFSNSRNTTLS